jgi:hypothetical protein
VGDAGDAGDAGTVNLLSNPSFELGCAGWSVEDGTESESSVVRSGSRSCQYCPKQTNPVTDAFYQTVTGSLPSGAQYYAEIWVHGAPGAATSDPLTLNIALTGGSTALTGPDGTGQTPDGTWRRITTLLSTNEAGTGLKLMITPGATSTCVLIDDAVLTRIK